MPSEKSQLLIEALESILGKILENMEAKVDRATFNQLATALGIVVDRVQRLREGTLDAPDEQSPKVCLDNLNPEEFTHFTQLLEIVGKPPRQSGQ